MSSLEISKRWDDITFKQLKRFLPILFFVAGAGYAVGKVYARAIDKINDHETRITKIEKALEVLPGIKDGVDILVGRKQRHER